MGQYHSCVAQQQRDDTYEAVRHYALGAGAKLAEQAYCIDWGEGQGEAAPYVASVGLLALIGPWRDARLAVIGDYAEGCTIPGWPLELHRFYGWAYADDESSPPQPVTDVTETAIGMVGEAFGWSFTAPGYDPEGMWRDIVAPEDRAERVARIKGAHRPDNVLVAIHAGEFLDPVPFGSPTQPWLLPLVGWAWPTAYAMLAVSDGRGGGDWRIDPPGRWAGSRLTVMDRSVALAAGATDVTEFALPHAKHQAGRWLAADEALGR